MISASAASPGIRALAIVILGLLAGCEPGAKMWREAADEVRKLARDGDIVVIVPAWQSHRAKHFEGLEVEASDKPLSLSLGNYRRLFLVSEGPHEGSGPGHIVGALERRYGEPTHQRVNFLSIRRYDLRTRASEPAFDFMAKIKDAQIKVTQEGEETPCGAWRQGSGRKGDFCQWGKSRWQYVGATSGAADGEARPCIWAHPADHKNVEITFSDVDVSELENPRLQGSYAILDSGIRNRAGRMVTLELMLDGEGLGRHYVHRQAGWHDFDVALTEDRGDGARGKRELRFVVSTAGESGRHFCFDARLVDAKK